ncbi:cell envelope integrity protein TolA [Xylophilus sp.]|uniref:cell envelope integrity protein TolA n=1 Tax=Xylophilus sp. TaxID=2653893 RepID=UPI0013B7925B|nr:cell envelope integrity protein TolA [Xylophilus sp.]KAF1046845.1 MAG: Ribonuclease Y [Xylophilus sp.]
MPNYDERDQLAPPRPPGRLRAVALAVVVHAALIAALTWGVHWKTSADQPAVEAELWSAVPQQAAPRLAAPPPEPTPPAPPPPPEPRPAPPPPPPPPPPQAQPDTREADIALEREKKKKQQEKERQERLRAEQQKKEQERAEREERERQEKLAQDKKKQQLEAQREKERQQQRLAQEEKEQREKERQDKLAEEKKKQQQAAADARKREAARQAQEEKQLAALRGDRADNLKRLQGLAGATGGATATGSAQRSSGPSGSYGGKVAAKVRPNITFTDDVGGNPAAEVEVRASPDGTIVGKRLVKSSGVKSWDDAVLRAIDKTETLPRDVDGRVPSSLLLAFRPKD